MWYTQRRMTRPAVRFTAIVLILGAVAIVAETPPSGDRNLYQTIGRQLVVLDCHDVHCFRILVAPILEHLPGPSLLKWKTYAVLASAASAIALGQLCLVLGLSARAAGFATWISAFGFGPLQSVFDPYTSDPVMYLVGPLMMADLLRGRLAGPTVVGSIGVLAKEFAAVPLWMFALMSAVRRQWDMASRAALAALTATLVWFALQTIFMTLYNYSYGGNPSVNLLGGGYFAVWVAALGRPRAAAYLFLAFGPLFVLLAAGLVRADRTLRLLAWSALPPAIAFMYVQQPDRALWNFHFVVIPIAMLVLQELPDRLCWLFVIAFGAANVRLGDQQPAVVSWIRFVMLMISIAVAVFAVAAFMRRARPGAAIEESSADYRPYR
jgi:hypothetical protein